MLRLLAAACLCAGLVTMGGATNGADGPRPGLPRHTEPGGGWTQVVQGGAAEAARAKQLIRVPMQVSTAYAWVDSVQGAPADPVHEYHTATNFVYLMAEADAPHTYGMTAPFSVKTVAFGNIPVVATLRLAQRRTASDLPIPILFTAKDELMRTSGQVYHDVDLSDVLSVQVESIAVDGEDLNLRPGCTTTQPATIKLHGNGFHSSDAWVDQSQPWLSDVYVPGLGGRLSGTVDVPGFERCVTRSGEDISPLLTAAVSGPDNAVSLHVSRVFMECTPQHPPLAGDYDATALCPDKLPGSVPLDPQ